MFNIKTTKPIYTNDFILCSEKMESKCEAKQKEQKTFEFQIPRSIFISEGEEERIKVPLNEKPLACGPSSSLSGRLFKV